MSQLEFGAPTAQAVLDAIEAEPQAHDQRRWTYTNNCGTTRCVAGWAMFLHGYSDMEIDIIACHNKPFPVRDAAAPLLGLGLRDAHHLFYCTSNKEAVEALRWVALGKELDWPSIRDHAADPRGVLQHALLDPDA